jgi:hypothetical protein
LAERGMSERVREKLIGVKKRFEEDVTVVKDALVCT